MYITQVLQYSATLQQLESPLVLNPLPINFFQYLNAYKCKWPLKILNPKPSRNGTFDAHNKLFDLMSSKPLDQKNSNALDINSIMSFAHKSTKQYVRLSRRSRSDPTCPPADLSEQLQRQTRKEISPLRKRVAKGSSRDLFGMGLKLIRRNKDLFRRSCKLFF